MFSRPHELRICCSAVLLAFLLATGGRSFGGASQGTEYEQKARLICTFARYIEWPGKKFLRPDAPFVIGVFGTDPISDILREIVQSQGIKGRSVQILHITAKEQLPGCHIVFVSRSEDGRLGPVLSAVRHENILSVGESDKFYKDGGVITFFNDGIRWTYRLNDKAAGRERLSLKPVIYQLAARPDGPMAAQARPAAPEMD